MFSPLVAYRGSGSGMEVATIPRCICTFCENGWTIPVGYERPEVVKQLEEVAKDHFLQRVIIQDDGESSMDLNSSRLSLQGCSTSLQQSIILCDGCVMQFGSTEEKILKAQKSMLLKMTGLKDFSEILADPWLDVKRMAYAKLKVRENEINEKLRVIEVAVPIMMSMSTGNQNVTTPVLTTNASSSSTSDVRAIESLSHVPGSPQVVFASSILPVICSNVQVEFIDHSQPPHSSTSSAANNAQEPTLNQQSTPTSNASSSSSSESESESKKTAIEAGVSMNTGTSEGALPALLKTAITTTSAASTRGNMKKSEIISDSEEDSDSDDSDIELEKATVKGNANNIIQSKAKEATGDVENDARSNGGNSTANESQLTSKMIPEDEELFNTPPSSVHQEETQETKQIDNSIKARSKTTIQKRKKDVPAKTPLPAANTKSHDKLAARKPGKSSPEDNPMNKAKTSKKRILTPTEDDDAKKKEVPGKRCRKLSSEDGSSKAKSANSQSQIDKLLACARGKVASPSPVKTVPGKQKAKMIGHRLVSDSSDCDDSSSDDDYVKKSPTKKH